MFRFSDKHIEEYQSLGYTVFRNVVPPTLIEELRRECERGVQVARERSGMSAQRFQPVAAFPVNQKPFEEFQNLPEVADAISRILNITYQPTGLDLLGVLVEPAEHAWCTPWHRDWRDTHQALDLEDWEARYQDTELFNQANCALYEDSCTWIVPGSHLRSDTDAEAARFPERPIAGPDLEGLSNAERERVCLDYCYSMPGAQRLQLDAGDYCFYRSILWHIGNYIPYRKRATLHDAAFTPAFKAWWQSAPQIASERVAQGVPWENPNRHRIVA